MAILLNSSGNDNTTWKKSLSMLLPGIPIHIYPEVPVPEDIKYAIVWNHPFGDLQRYENLQAILSLGAGMEHLTTDPDLPGVPLVSLGDRSMAQDMANFALYWVVNIHRKLDIYRQQQHKQVWKQNHFLPTRDCKVTILGMGRIARHIADFVKQAAYNVTVWDFSPKPNDPIKAAFGKDALPEILGISDIVICCLALNNRSANLIDATFLQNMLPHSYLINISRGNILDQEALLNALNNRALRGAVLDVFSEEPLPANHPLWRHESVTITPHIAGPTDISSACKTLSRDIHRLERGLEPELIFDPSRGNQL